MPKRHIMKVGICYLPLGSVFSSGSAQTAIHLAELFVLLGHEVTLISLAAGRKWFDDCQALPALAGFKCISVNEAGEVCDLLIDTLGCMTKEAREAWGRRCVVFVRTAPVLADQESSVYGMNTFITNYEGVDEIWTWRAWDHGEIDYLRTLSHLPVRELPFVWFPTLVEFYRREAGLGAWRSGNKSICHIMETNMKVSSCCHVPLMICQHAELKDVYVHCSEHIVDGKYFSENFKKHLQLEDVHWVGRQKIADLLAEEGSFILSHMRFRMLRPLLLDCVWLGIPVVHNSPWLRDFCHGYEQLYYENNSVSGASAAIGQVGGWHSDPESQEALIKRVSTLSEDDTSLWIDALKGGVIHGGDGKVVGRGELIVQFVDFWAGFQANYNFFVLLLQEALRSAGRETRILGVGENWSGRADLIIFGPYTQKWRELDPKIPKVYFTGEWDGGMPAEGPGVFLSLGFSHVEGNKYIRLPLWVLYINWFGADSKRLVNPTILELEEVTCAPDKKAWNEREKFCAFVVSNPNCEERNAAFRELNTWKGVDSAGAVFNNVGYKLEGGPGGGGGERVKVEFFKKYKYVLCYENKLMPGYTTEKLLHAKAAGCVPIYWGDGSDFNQAGFLNMTRREEDVDNSESEWQSLRETVKDNWASGEAESMAAQPALSSEKVEWCRGLLSRVAKKILNKVCGEDVARAVPEFLGRGLGTAALALLPKLILTTSASRETAGELPLWLESAIKIKQRVRDASILIRWEGDGQPSCCKERWIRAESSIYVDICQTLSEGQEAIILHVPVELEILDLPASLLAMVSVGDGGTYQIEAYRGSEILCFKAARCMAGLLRGRRIINPESCSAYFRKHKPSFCKGISNCTLINLKRRPDRLARFYKSHPEAEGQVDVFEAFDGRSITLGPNLVRLFLNNNYGWKKGAIGCNLSHLALWKKLAETSSVNNMLILEDDVKFSNDQWRKTIESAMEVAPTNYDILYLGGLLPPNMEGWNVVKEPLNNYWCRIGLNKHFGQVEASRFYHFCTYSYILSKEGAHKLLSIIAAEGGYKNVVDHQILHSWQDLNIYVSEPLFAGCYQDEDPKYKASNFNDIGRADVIDSDIWTSRDCFELDGSTQISMNLDIDAALMEASIGSVQPLQATLICFSEELRVVFERLWLGDIFGLGEDAFSNVSVVNPNLPINNAIVLYQGRDSGQVAHLELWLDTIEKRGWSCGIIHLSDEFSADDIGFYGRPGVRWVLRNYWRDGLAPFAAKVKVIPLGYHHKSIAAGGSRPLTERQLAWSFHGTAWMRWPVRRHMLEVLREVIPHRSSVRGAWEEPGTPGPEMLADMENSWIVPCPEGNNTESFRIYEALEAGAFPVLVDEGRGKWSTQFYLSLQAALPSICILRCWEDAIEIFRKAQCAPEEFEMRRNRLVGEWEIWKRQLKVELQQLIGK